MVLIRIVTLESLKTNSRVYAKYVPTKLNGKADALSRMDFKRFKNLAGDTMDMEKTEVPEVLWPMKKLWLY